MWEIMCRVKQGWRREVGTTVLWGATLQYGQLSEKKGRLMFVRVHPEIMCRVKQGWRTDVGTTVPWGTTLQYGKLSEKIGRLIFVRVHPKKTRVILVVFVSLCADTDQFSRRVSSVSVYDNDTTNRYRHTDRATHREVHIQNTLCVIGMVCLFAEAQPRETTTKKYGW